MWDTYKFNKAGCGATALGLITGKNPFFFKSKKSHYSDRFMVKSLRKEGFSVYEVNKANLSNREEWKYSLADNHLILFSSLLKKKEASWMVMFNNNIYHNFERTTASYIDFVNFPIDSMYVIFKKEWAKKS